MESQLSLKMIAKPAVQQAAAGAASAPMRERREGDGREGGRARRPSECVPVLLYEHVKINDLIMASE